MSRDERALSAVPAWIWATLALCLAAQIASQAHRAATPASTTLPPAPRADVLRLASFGEREAAARLTMLYVQSVDFVAGRALPYRDLDYGRLIGWLGAVLALDPRSNYPLFAATRVYAEVPDEPRARVALEFVYRSFLEAPDRRWEPLAQGALLAKHRLKDLPLARRYAAAVQRHATGPNVPLWAKQMEIFILEDMNELEAAKVMIGGLLASGTLHDPQEIRFLKERLEALEAQSKGQRNVK